MQTFLTIFHIAPVAHVKALSKAFFSILLVASFLASCTTDNPTNIINSDGIVNPTVGCPEGLVALTLDGAESLTLTDDLITVTVGADFTDTPTFSYEPTAVTTATDSVTVTATDTAGNTGTCTFSVTVSENPVTLTACPADINNGVINIARTWTAPTIVNGPEGSTTAVSVTSDDATASTAMLTETGGTFIEAGTYTVTFTATTADASPIVGTDGAISCSFEVIVTETAQALVIACPAGDALAVVIPFGETSVTLADAGLVATSTGGTGNINFSYSTESLSTTDDGTTITATAADEATPADMDECTFTVTVTEAPTPTFTTGCSAPSANPVVDTLFTWTPPPTITDPPEGATIEARVTSENVANATVTATTGTFTEVGDYTIVFTATDSSDAAIMVGDDTPSPLTCTFDVTVEGMPKPENSAFSLATHIDPPSANNPFLIQNAEDLAMFATVVNNANSNMFTGINDTDGNYRTADYLLSTDITLDAPTGGATSNFTPIGPGGSENSMVTCNETCFQGTFDGNNNTISGMQYNNGNTTNLGLFGVIMGTDTDEVSIFDLTLINSVISNNGSNTGALVGVVLTNSMISNVTVTGENAMITGGASSKGGLVGVNAGMIESSSSTITVTSTGSSVGGLVGNNSGTIITSYASGTINAESQVGGLVGQNDSTGTITASAATGDVTATSTTSGEAGGLVGFNNAGMISASYASGDVVGINSIGGLVGQQLGSATIMNSYASGNATGSDTSSSNIGGLVGFNRGTSTIMDSYARGVISTGNNLGLLVGGNENSTATTGGITNSYGIRGIDVTTGCNRVSPTGGGNIGVCPTDIVQSAAALQASNTPGEIYADWDTTIWDFAENQYPALQTGGEDQLPIAQFTAACQRQENCLETE